MSVSGYHRVKPLDNGGGSGIIKSENKETMVTDVRYIGKIDIEKYKCITKDIVTDDVIITEERIQHIKNRHPQDYEKYCEYMSEIVKNPQFIIEANKPNTALLLKSFEENGVPFKTILRLVTSNDNPEFKNSVITFMKINDKEWSRLINNKKILYKSE
ncbi:MAG: PBECR2 nuclease fold domain-containing protein [Oscillospiraceae bacterium]